MTGRDLRSEVTYLREDTTVRLNTAREYLVPKNRNRDNGTPRSMKKQYTRTVPSLDGTRNTLQTLERPEMGDLWPVTLLVFTEGCNDL